LLYRKTIAGRLHPEGIFICITGTKATIRVWISNRTTGWSTSYNFELSQGVWVYCSCNIERRNLDIVLYLESPHFFHSWHPSARLVAAFDIPPIETIWSREFYTYMARTERDVVYTYTTGRAEDSARFQRLFIDADNTATRMCAHRKNIRPLVPLTFLSLRGYVDNVVTLWCSRSNITPEDFMRTTLHTFRQPYSTSV
jgi:hypothetical protein